MVTRLALVDVLSDRLDGASQTPAGVGLLGPAEPEAHDAHELGQTGHQMPRAPINAGRLYAHQDVAVAHRGPGDLLKPEDVLRCGAVCVLDDRLDRLDVVVPGCRRD